MNNFKVNNFPPEVIKELKYYVYRLIDPTNGETFYIGKGKGNRVFEHLKTAKKLIEEIDDSKDELDLKYEKIKKIKNSGLEVLHIIHRHGLDEKTALQVEAALIDAYPSLTNIANGHGSNEYGVMHAYEIVKKYNKGIANINHKVVMININRTIAEAQRDIYDSVRFAWRIDEKKVKQAEYVLAMDKGIIVGVFKPLEWRKATEKNFPEFFNHPRKRWGFIGKEAEKEVKDMYMDKRLPEQFQRKKGEANPIRYSY